VLPQAADRISRSLTTGADVLEVAPGPEPFEDAGVVLADRAPEVRGRRTWLVRDVCGREPWPFEDDRFDFAVCTALAVLRDPIGVCSELSRVSRAGYVQVPTIEHELALSGGPSRWLCDVVDAELVFVAKSGAVHRDPRVRVPQRWDARLSAAERVHGLFWEVRLPARERLIEDDALVEELAERVRRRFEPTSAEVALTEARRLGGLAGAAALRRIDELRGTR
jgi:hypothetical protein